MALTLRWLAFAVSATASLFGAWLFVKLAQADGWSGFDDVRLVLSTACVFWLTWGAMGGLLGLATSRRRTDRPARPPQGAGRTALLMPIYHEDPPSTFARVAAMSARLTALGAHEGIDIFILSDSQSFDAAAREALWLEQLLSDCEAREQVFYRRRAKNTGRKAGNIEDFIRRSGAAYEFAMVLDADSLMDSETILEMIAQIERQPSLGLLQSLPLIVHARSLFGRALQFSSRLYTPVYARGTALLQGREGPYWGHNAVFRVAAFAQSCGLPELAGRPPFGGQILSHDYVEAALLARAGYEVRLDPGLGGSFEEGPDNIVDYAKRDQRWCQGNLQHSRVLAAPSLAAWNRITLLQGILAYLMPPLWLVLLMISIAAADLSQRGSSGQRPDWAGWVLIGFVAGILVLPKLLIALVEIVAGRAGGISRSLNLLLSVVLEVVLSTLTAPVVLMFQVRAVLRVLLGVDGGWPPSNRSDGRVGLDQSWQSSWWISSCGGAGLAAVLLASPVLALWLLPVALPMMLAPFLIWVTSLPVPDGVLAAPGEAADGPVLREWQRIHQRWVERGEPVAAFAEEGTINVLG